MAGVSEDYGFEVRHADGARTVIEKVGWDRVPVLPDEARWHREKIIVWNRVVEPGWTWNGPPIPDCKPAYERFVPDRSGRIWVVRPGPGERLPDGVDGGGEAIDYYMRPLWRDRPLVGVFRETGEYLGTVDLPRGFRWFMPVPFIDGETVVAAVEDEEGVLFVKRFRLVPPS